MVKSPAVSIDPQDPRAPTEEQWAAMTPAEREQVVASLPSDVPFEVFMPEGDPHRIAKQRVLGSLGAFFQKIGRKVYLSSELGVYYPGEARFAPDVLAVVDVEPHPRMKWVVMSEGKGLDVVLEVHVSGEWQKDFEANRRRYARLGIPEYFLFDRIRNRLFGWRLPNAGARVYEAMVPQLGKFTSRVLGLDLGLEQDRVRFYSGTAPLPEAEELVGKLEAMVGELVDRRERERQELEAEVQQQRLELEREREGREREREGRERAEQERERAEQERERAEQERERAEQGREASLRRVAELEAELAKLIGGK